MSLQKVRQSQAEFLKELKSKIKPYKGRLEEVDIIVYPNVFPPATDTRLLAKHIKVSKGDRVLDITTGSGALAAVAGLQGASGIAADINPDAVKNAEDNFKRLNVNFISLESDLFTKIPREKFDLIISNGPYIEGKVTEALEYAFYGAKKYIDDLFSKAPLFLKKDGKILVTFAEWGLLAHFEQTAIDNGFDFKVIDKDTSADGERVYRLYQIFFRS